MPRIPRWVVWLLFPFISYLFLSSLWGLPTWLFGMQGIVVIAALHALAILIPLYYHRIDLLKYCGKFFLVGLGVAGGLPLLLWLFPDTPLVLLMYLAAPGSVFLSVEVPPRGFWDYAIAFGLYTWNTAICYTILGGMMYQMRRSAA